MMDKNSLDFSVYSFIGSLDREIKGIPLISYDIPQVVNTRPFMGKGLKSRLANKVFSVVMRPNRRATRDFWYAQNDTNHKLLQKIAVLEARVKALESSKGEK